jgi:hypothetical protein
VKSALFCLFYDLNCEELVGSQLGTLTLYRSAAQNYIKGKKTPEILKQFFI